MEQPILVSRSTPFLSNRYFISVYLYSITLGLIPPLSGNCSVILIKQKRAVKFVTPRYQDRGALAFAVILLTWVPHGCILVTLCRQFFNTSQVKLTVIQILVSITRIVCTTAVFSVVSEILNHQELEIVVNKFLQNKDKLPFQITSQRGADTLGILMLVGILFGNIFGALCTSVTCWLDMEPFPVVISDLFLGDPMYHSLFSSLSLNVATFIIFTFITLLLSRELAVGILLFESLLSCSIMHLRTLLQYTDSKNKEQVYMRYYFVALVHQHLNTVIGKILLNGLLISMLMLTSIAVFVIVYIKKAAMLVVFGCAFMFFLGLLLTVFTLRLGSFVRQLSVTFIETMHKKCSDKPLKSFWSRVWRFQRPVAINCEGQFAVREESVIVFIDILTNVIYNAVILM